MRFLFGIVAVLLLIIGWLAADNAHLRAETDRLGQNLAETKGERDTSRAALEFTAEITTRCQLAVRGALNWLEDRPGEEPMPDSDRIVLIRRDMHLDAEKCLGNARGRRGR